MLFRSRILELITYSSKAAPLSKISKGIRRYNTTSLLVFSRALINAGECLEAAFRKPSSLSLFISFSSRLISIGTTLLLKILGLRFSAAVLAP